MVVQDEGLPERLVEASNSLAGNTKLLSHSQQSPEVEIPNLCAEHNAEPGAPKDPELPCE